VFKVLIFLIFVYIIGGVLKKFPTFFIFFEKKFARNKFGCLIEQ